MDKIMSRINLDFANNLNTPTVYAKQGDINSRTLQITPYKNGQPMTIDSDMQATISVRKPDGSAVMLTATHTENLIVAGYTKSSLDVAGMAVAEVELTQNNNRIASQLFFIAIEPSAAYTTKNHSQGRYLECYGLTAIKAVTQSEYTSAIKDTKTLYIVESQSSIDIYFGTKKLAGGGVSVDLDNLDTNNSNLEIANLEVENNG